MGLQIYDDGSSVTTDASGAVVGVVNSAGVAQYVPPADGSAPMQEFRALFTQGVQAVLSTVSNRLSGSLAGSQPSGTPQRQATQASLQKYLPIALIAVLAVVGFHYLKS